jgi:hypothetical protein
MNIPDFIVVNLVSVFRLKVYLDADSDPGSGILSTMDPVSGMEKIGSGIRDLTSRIRSTAS